MKEAMLGGLLSALITIGVGAFTLYGDVRALTEKVAATNEAINLFVTQTSAAVANHEERLRVLEVSVGRTYIQPR